MGTFLFANPTSGRYSKKVINSTIDKLESAGIMTTVHLVQTPGDVRSCCDSIYRTTPRPLIIVAAGDGTINAVINSLIPGTTTLAILPLGTSNVLSAELRIRTVDEGIRRIIVRKVSPLSVGQLKMESGTYRFVLMAGTGLDGAVVRDLNHTAKRFLKQGGYLLSAIKNLFTWDSSSIQIVTGKESINCHTAIVSNASRYGGNFILAPEASIFSQGLVVGCIKKNDRSGYLAALYDLFSGNSGSNTRIQRITCKEVEIKGRKPIQIDGDFVGYSPAKLEALTDLCNIVV